MEQCHVIAGKLGPNGIKLVEATSAAEAIEWLKKNG